MFLNDHSSFCWCEFSILIKKIAFVFYFFLLQEKFEVALSGRSPPATAHYNYAILHLIKNTPVEKGKNGGGNNATAQIAEGNGTAVEVSSDGSSAEANVAANISAAEEEEEETTAASAVAEDEPPQKPTEQSPEEALEVAVHHLERAVALDPSFDKAHEMLGSALEELGRTEDAMAALAAAFERHPGPATVAPHPGTSEKDESGKEEGGSVLTNPVLRKLQALARKLKEEKNAAAVGGSDGDESGNSSSSNSSSSSSSNSSSSSSTEPTAKEASFAKCRDEAEAWEVLAADRCFALHVRMYPRDAPALTAYGLFIATQSAPTYPEGLAGVAAALGAGTGGGNGRRRLEEALALLQRASRLAPKDPEPAILACNVQRQIAEQGGGLGGARVGGPHPFAIAEGCLLAAVSKYRHPAAYRNLAALRVQMGRMDEAAEADAMASALEGGRGVKKL